MTSMFDQDLPPTAANFAAMSPLSFIERTAQVYPNRLAVVHGWGAQTVRQTWSQTYDRCRQLASALVQNGVGKNDTVAVMLPNTPPMVEAHFGIPMAGAVLNALNTRLDPETLAFMLDHGEAKVVIVDPEFSATLKKALALRQSTRPLMVIDVQDALYTAWAKPTTKLFWRKATRSLLGHCQTTSGTRLPLTTRVAPPAIPRAWCTTTGAQPRMRFPIFWNGTCLSTRPICGRCRCSIATVGAFRGRWPPVRA